jgi:flagellar biosynthesis/type III secretory pathway protein FliH
VELPKYKPADRGSRAIKDLWLRFLTEIDESTESVDAAMSDNPEISEALGIVKRSAYSDADLYRYNDYLLEIMTQRNAMLNERNEGRAEGFAEGRAEGEQQKAISIARAMKQHGDAIDYIALIIGLTPSEITSL